MKIRTLERFSAILGAFLCAVLAVVACLAKEMTTKDVAFFAVLGAGFGYGWFRLRDPQ
jgi:hypothetical protein